MDEYPWLMHTAIDTTDCRGLAEFYRELLGLHYRPGDEPPTDGDDDADWLVLVDSDGRRKLAFQQVDRLEPTTWPEHDVPMQMHLDFSVSSADELARHRDRALALGARIVLDRTDDEDEALYVLADPSGHPFCLLVR
jgi:catechol 2,3-dioxygenase-like lactoylglutathione lyase family enzyme